MVILYNVQTFNKCFFVFCFRTFNTIWTTLCLKLEIHKSELVNTLNMDLHWKEGKVHIYIIYTTWGSITSFVKHRNARPLNPLNVSPGTTSSFTSIYFVHTLLFCKFKQMNERLRCLIFNEITKNSANVFALCHFWATECKMTIWFKLN